MVKTKKHTSFSLTNHSFFPFFIRQIENRLGPDGVASLSEALKVNTTLIKLHLRCGNKRKHATITFFIHFFCLHKSTDNAIQDAGTTALSEALKINTALVSLNLERESMR